MFLNPRTFAGSMAVAAGLALAATAYAQTGKQAPPPAGLNLTEAQRNEIRTLREAQQSDAQALRDKMRAARRQMQQAMRADVPDEAAVRSAAEAVAALQVDQAVLQARARSQFIKVLTPEQQARMKEARARATERAQRATRARRDARDQRQMMQRQRMMRQQYLRWWRGWL